MQRKIVIDPGHGGKDPGAVGNGLQEKDITLEIAKGVKEILANYAEVFLTRNDDTFLELSERVDFANKAGADFFLSIHVNAGGGTGFESYINTSASSGSERYQQVIHEEASSFYLKSGFPDRGMKRAGFTVLRKTAMPALLLENLFIDNPVNAGKLKDPGFLKQVSGILSRAVIKALNITAPEKPTAPEQSEPHWAEADFRRLKEAGLVFGDHSLDSRVSWGELSAVLARLLKKLRV